MLGSLVLETAIGLVFVYLIFSLIASAIAEYISAPFDRRGEHLKHILFNLFDNDDPQGRTLLNMFVTHPMVQALNSTDWKPKFQSALDRLGAEQEQFKRARFKWQAASSAVADAGAARSAAGAADAAAARATSATAKLKSALKSLTPASPATNAAFEKALAEAEAAVAAAESAASAADIAARSAIASGAEVKSARAGQASPTDTPATSTSTATTSEPDRSLAADTPVTPPTSPGEPPPAATAVPPAPTPTPAPAASPPVADPSVRARVVIDRAGKASASAIQSATAARKAASAAEKAKRGLDGDLIQLVTVPKYIPDSTFVDVLLHVLTADETIEALSQERDDEGQREASSPNDTNTFWNRFAAALKVVGGVASRLPDNNVKNDVTRRIAAIEETLRLAGNGAAEAMSVVGRLESGTSELRAAIAAIPDDTLRAALENEIEHSLRPLHVLGQDILTLQRAGRAVAMMADSSIKTALSSFLNQAGEDLGAFKRSVSSWFDDVMNHASGWYKRNTQRILMVIALVLCTLNNVDTVALVGRLSTDREMRTATEKEARAFVGTEGESAPNPSPVAGHQASQGTNPNQRAEEYKSALQATTLPLWWTKTEWDNLWYAIEYMEAKVLPAGAIISPDEPPGTGKSLNPAYRFSPNYSWILAKLTGLLISIMAVSMGAPFWFDVLNKLVNVRLVGKRPDPSVTDAPVVTTAVTTTRPAG